MSLEIALAEIKRAEDILRSRYHYEHPIFGHLATARECVEAEIPPAAPPTPEVEVTSGPAPTEEEGEAETEGQPPARRAGRKA
jgi:hypothetical protein